MRHGRNLLLLVLGLTFPATLGCQSAGLRFLSMIGIQQKPLIIALVAERSDTKSASALEALNPFGVYSDLGKALEHELGRPVGWDLCFALQLPDSLRSGMSHLAFVGPFEYAELAAKLDCDVVAVALDAQHRTARPALLVVAADAAIEKPADLAGKSVAFGPAGNARTHYAGLMLLAQNGVGKDKLSLEVLPVPGSLKHFPNARGVLQSVLHGSSAGGFVDLEDWEALPEQSADQDEPARERLRVIAQTADIPNQLVVASPKLEPAWRDSIARVLFSAAEKQPQALERIGASGYARPDPAMLKTCRELINAEASPSSQPANASSEAQDADSP